MPRRVPTLLLLAVAPVAAAVVCAALAPQLAPYDPTRGDDRGGGEEQERGHPRTHQAWSLTRGSSHA